jgi:hypothetical protein
VIKSRVLFASFVLFLIISLLVYVIVDFRPTRERANESLRKENYLFILELYESENTIGEEDTSILSQAVSGLERGINQTKDEKSKEALLQKLNKIYKIQNTTYTKDEQNCYSLEDPYFSQLKQNTYWYQKSLLQKIPSSVLCNSKDKNSEYLNRILIEDPKNFTKETSIAIVDLFRSEMNPIGEIESEFLKEIVHFLATQDSSDFYQNIFQVTGDRVNFRLGSGVEYPVVGQLNSEEELYCFDQDTQEEVIGNKMGHWKECFSPKLFRSGWIFSPQIQSIKSDTYWVNRCKSRFSMQEARIQIDFETWKEGDSPLYFQGKYIPTKRKVQSGEVGFTVYRPEDGKQEMICRRFSEEFHYFEISYEVESSRLPVPLVNFNMIHSGSSYPAFRFLSTENAILCNDEKFLLDGKRPRETISLKISSGKGRPIQGNLIRENSGLLQKVESLPMDLDWSSQEDYSWEICIPQAIKKSSDSAVLYGFRLGQ